MPGKCIQVKVRRPLDGPMPVGEELPSDHRRALEEVHVEAREGCNDTVSGESVFFLVGEAYEILVKTLFVPEWVPKMPGPGVTLRRRGGNRWFAPFVLGFEFFGEP